MMYNTTAGDPNSAVYYYCSDNLGSTVALVDSSGSVVERYSYDVWGEPTIYDGSGNEITESDVANPFMFTAREVDFLDDGNLKLQHNRHRVYNSKLARWMQSDPLGTVPNGYMNPSNPIGQYRDGVNVYQYVGSKPIAKKDIFGLMPNIATFFDPYGDLRQRGLCKGNGTSCPECGDADSYDGIDQKWWAHYNSGNGERVNIDDWGYLDEFKAEYQNHISSLLLEAYRSIDSTLRIMKCSKGTSFAMRSINIDLFTSTSRVNDKYSWELARKMLQDRGDVDNINVLPVGNTTITLKGKCNLTKLCCTKTGFYRCCLKYRMEDEFKDPWDFFNVIPQPDIETGQPYRIYASWNKFLSGMISGLY